MAAKHEAEKNKNSPSPSRPNEFVLVVSRLITLLEII